MRLLHLADLHIDLRPSRAQSTLEMVDWVRHAARSLKPDVVVIAGDLYDRCPTPAEGLMATQMLADIVGIGRCTVILLNGNHDPRPETKRAGYLPGVRGFSESGAVAIGDEGGPATTICVLPWPESSGIAASRSAGIEERARIKREALRDILRGAAADKPDLLVAHAWIEGAQREDAQELLPGDDTRLTLDDLALCGASGVALGHLHRRHQVGEGNVWYAGSPRFTNWGETEQDRGGLLWTRQNGGWTVTPVNAPLRKRRIIEWEMDHGVLSETRSGDAAGEEVLVVATFPARQRAVAQEALAALVADLKAQGAYSVEVKPVPDPETRTIRSEAVKSATSLEEKVRIWLRENDQAHDPDIDRMIARLRKVMSAEVGN